MYSDPSNVDPGLPGCLMPIGGAEDKTVRSVVLSRFVALSGGTPARLVVIPTASSFPAAQGSRYCDLFGALGAASVHCVDVESRAQGSDPALLALLAEATGIFLTGGDQVKLVTMLAGTPLAALIRARFAAGAAVAGTSAGASALSQHMIAFGRSGPVPSQRMVQLAPGLGLAPRVIIDQHFRQRDRLGRLTTAVALNPALIGVGVDEDTALIIHPDRPCEVIGSGSVTIVDGSQLESTNIYSVKAHRPISVLGMKVHILTHGCRYDLATRQPQPAALDPAV